ncbi:PREDICTED: sodium channel protein Nach-like, partial [Papilio xuthus]|uniref:Sodium channel protein Nach-like n=1 Tax=Papilio xuthus TaxID=66420 RepID=A0AAJ7E8S8_PAPXU
YYPHSRFFWLAAFCCSVICAAFFILNVYHKWRSSPMIVSINPENMHLQDLPFPAITVCNVNQAKKSVAERYINTGNSLDKKLLNSLCGTQRDADIFEDDIAESANWDYTRSFLINVTQPCNEMLAMCLWDSRSMNCQDLFNAQLTDEGLCCTFNVVHRDNMFRNPRDLNDLNLTFPSPSVDWTPEGGYPADAPPDGFPWKPKGIGTNHGLTLVLDANIAEYYCASTKSMGFKILLHNPTETPNIAKIGEIYGPGIEARVAIQPRILDAQPSLKDIDVKKRLCLFSSEKELVFYRTYTLRNCEMECEARSMLDRCKCVLYYMPKNKSTRICGKADAKCYSNVKLTAQSDSEASCDECLPACNEIAFFERLSTAPLNKALIGQYSTILLNRTPDYFT